MPRCRDGKWCIDDLCHMTEVTICGVWLSEDRGPDGDYPAEDDDEWGEEYEDDMEPSP